MSDPYPNRRHFIKRSVGGALAWATTSNTIRPCDAAKTTPNPTHQDTFGLLDRPGGKIPVIFDTDIGSDIDDTWALFYLLKCPELDIQLIATDAGQADYRTRLTAKFLTETGRSDIPIAKSVGDQAGLGNQRDWLDGFSLENYPGKVHDDAADAIIQCIHSSENPVTVICVGAVPNISEALRRDPTICRNARFVGMHGSIYKGYGNSDDPVAESNVRYGVVPLRETFAANWNCSITPLDTCGIVKLQGDRYQSVIRSNAIGITALMDNYVAWLERVSWLDVKPDPTIKSSTLFDLVAVTMAFTEAWLDMQSLPLVVTDDGFTRIAQNASQEKLVRCALSWKNLDGYLDHVVERLTS